MAESTRAVVVTIEVDTNKDTYKKCLTWDGDETREEFEHRVVAAIGELTEMA